MNLRLAAALGRGFFAANGLRLTLTLACIALGVALAGAVHTVHTSALAEIDRAARSLAGAADLEVRGPRNGFDDALFAAVASRPGVAAASPIVEVQAGLPNGQALRVLGIDPFRAARMQPAFVASPAATGSLHSTTFLDDKSVWLSPAAMANLRLRPGDPLTLLAGTAARTYRVAGVLPGLDAGAIAIMDIAAVQQDFGRVGRLSRIELRLAPGADQQGFRARLAASLPPGVVLSPAASLSGRVASITRAYRVNLDALALVALATGAFLVFSTLALQAARRRQEYALLRALGVTRRGIGLLVVLEGFAIGAVGAAIGTGLGLIGSRALLQRSGGDLGAGFFGDLSGTFTPDPWGLGGIALLGIGVSVAGALWVAHAVGRIDVAEALRDRAVDLPFTPRGHGWLAVALVVAGVPLLFAPSIGQLPLAGYAAISLWLCGSVVAVAPLCRAILGRLAPRGVIPGLALAQVRHLPGHLAASVAGIVVSASLCVAMAIMVFSFRQSLDDWLRGVVGADLYVRAAQGAETGYFTAEEVERVREVAGIASLETLRYDRLAMDAHAMPLTLVARPVNARVLAGFQAEPSAMPPRDAAIAVWMSEAARDLHGWKVGERIELPVAGRKIPVRVAGLIRDYARIWGAVIMDIEDYRRITGDGRSHDLAIHFAPGAKSRQVQAAIRTALPQASGLAMEDAADIHRRSLEIFDRSFAVTYALEAIAIVIGLAGVTSSFAALAWSRRREFGVLRFLGLTRREILVMLTYEGAATGALGAAIGLASGVAISLVLIHVVNRQSFHWGMEVHWPIAALATLTLGIIAACALGARASGAFAVRREAILAVKDDA